MDDIWGRNKTNAYVDRVRRIRKIHPTARLSANYDSESKFKSWRIVHGFHTYKVVQNDTKYPLSGDFYDEEDAWMHAAEMLGVL